ncbi:MAG: hypothetical protein K2K21_11670 [Lachnospiraceae bacterium]|nr:hypothetical protein [Lachnospiraceae bacterium]
MKIIKQLIKLHKFIFSVAFLFTFLSIILNLCWNKFLADILDVFEDMSAVNFEDRTRTFFAVLPVAIFIVFLHTLSEYLSSYLASYTCETFAHEMRIGYARYYLQSDIRMLSGLNIGEEQSAMQNELKDISGYLNENLFSLVKQFGTFAVTIAFLLCQNVKLTLIYILPVVPLIIYCSFSSKTIKNYTGQCQNGMKKINGLADIILELFPIIQVFGAYKLVNDAIIEKFSEYEKLNVKKERVTAGLMSLSGILSFVPLLILLGFGGAMAVNGKISIGIFYIFINLSGNVSGFLQNMPGIYANFRRFEASVGRLEEKLVLNEG